MQLAIRAWSYLRLTTPEMVGRVSLGVGQENGNHINAGSTSIPLARGQRCDKGDC